MMRQCCALSDASLTTIIFPWLFLSDWQVLCCRCLSWVLVDSIIQEHMLVAFVGLGLIYLRRLVLVVRFGTGGSDKEVG